MELAPMDGNVEEDKTYNNLLKKFKIAVLFTLPVFIISMSAMFALMCTNILQRRLQQPFQ
ncbi:hypothetical protein [Parafilimonas sp.]|uniref:hypothetical protein n=1 Tax=Parafilimonas sp. TaxID=1969739 RepID=UPI0039E22035